jgi:hypothetical protein
MPCRVAVAAAVVNFEKLGTFRRLRRLDDGPPPTGLHFVGGAAPDFGVRLKPHATHATAPGPYIAPAGRSLRNARRAGAPRVTER